MDNKTNRLMEDALLIYTKDGALTPQEYHRRKTPQVRTREEGVKSIYKILFGGDQTKTQPEGWVL